MFRAAGLICIFLLSASVSAIDVDGGHRIEPSIPAPGLPFNLLLDKAEVQTEDKAVMGVDANGNAVQEGQHDSQKPMMRSEGASEAASAVSSEQLPRQVLKNPPVLKLIGDEDQKEASMVQLDQMPGFAGAFQQPKNTPCEIPRWRNGDPLCTEAGLKSRSFLLPDPNTGTPKLYLRDGGLCSTQCSSQRTFQSPGLSNITCAHGYWMDAHGNGVSILRCRMEWYTSAALITVHVLAIVAIWQCCVAMQTPKKILVPPGGPGAEPVSPYGAYGQGDLPHQTQEGH